MTSAPQEWQKQMANRIDRVEDLAARIHLEPGEAMEIAEVGKYFRWSITPYYASLMHRTDPRCPIRQQAVPAPAELRIEHGEADPLGEEASSPVKGLIHKYPDRVAVVATHRCAVYCRHCTRRRVVGQVDRQLTPSQLARSLNYIRSNPQIRDVLITGGDPLVAGDGWIENLLKQVRAIEHVEVIRVGTRTPCTLPQRITPGLCETLARYHPIWVNTQFNHPRELTEEAALACDRLLRAGIPVGNQTVLLRGVNDSLEVMRALVHGLVRMRVRPYYLFQCDRVGGTSHFWTPWQTGIDIIMGLRGHTSGFAIPTLVVDTPAGKIPLPTEPPLAWDGHHLTLRNYHGDLVVIPGDAPTPEPSPVLSHA